MAGGACAHGYTRAPWRAKRHALSPARRFSVIGCCCGSSDSSFTAPLRAQSHQLTFSPASAALIKRITAPIYTRPPATYSEEWLEQYVPNESTYLPEQERNALQALGKRAPIYGRAGTYIQKIYNRLLIDFSYNSARLEGNTYTLADPERLLLQPKARRALSAS